MPLKNFYKILLLTTVLLCGLYAHAQNVSINFIESNIITDNSGIVNAHVRIKNNSPLAVEGMFDAHSSHEDLYLVQRKSRSLNLQPGDSIFIPIKGIVSTTAIAGNKVKIEAVFDTNQNRAFSTEIPVIISEKKQVKMLITETNLIYEQIGDSLSIPIRLYNEGNTAQTITIVARYPDFVLKNSIESKTLTIKPYSDTIVNLTKEVTRNILNQEDFSITINAIYSNGDIIGSSYVRAGSLKQNRRYTVPYQETPATIYQQPNQVTASYQRNNNETGIYYLYANAETKLSENSAIKANLDMNWWDNSDMVFLRNTWLRYEHTKFGVQAGNIVKFSDINLVGRGGEVYYKPSEKSTIEVGAINKAYNLVDNFDESLGEAGWITYEHNGGIAKKGYEVNVYYDSDDFYKTNSYLGSSRFKIFKKENLELMAGGAVSSSSSQETKESKTGGAAELTAVGRIKNFTYSSSNYLSTGYFAGLRKGLVNFNERISYNPNKYSFWIAYNYLSSEPEYFANENASMQFSNTRYDIGVSKRFNSLSVSVNPYIYTEKRSELLYGQTENTNYTMEAARANVGVMYYNYASKQNISLTFEGGFFNSGGLSNQLHYRANLNYNWKMFNLTTFYQNNFFYLGEIISLQQNNNEETYYNFSISPSLRFSLFNNKLDINTAVLYSKNTFVTDMRQANARIDYNLSKDFKLFATGFYSEFSAGLMQTNSIMAGVTKRFNTIRIDNTKSDLEVYVYYEMNGKGALDPENLPAADQLVIIEGKAFKTNSNGIIKYRSLPAGDYELRPSTGNEWHAQPLKININQDTKVAIGLNKTCTIKGRIHYQSTDKSYEISRKTSGLSIIAVDDTGNVFHTRTDEGGSFVFYLPKGNYTVTLEKNGVSEYVEIDNNNQIIQAQPNEIKEVNFTLNIKEKRVETRKFSSRGFPSMSKGEDDKKKKKK